MNVCTARGNVLLSLSQFQYHQQRHTHHHFFTVLRRSGTKARYGAMRWTHRLSTEEMMRGSDILRAYADFHHQVIALRTAYQMPGTEVLYCPTHLLLHARY
eukprot:2749512-Rhodomonas_salina.1